MAAQHICGVFHHEGSPRDASGCVLTEGHAGPHEYRDENGHAWLWETDLECDCEHCALCEGDYCTVYWRKPPPPSNPQVKP